MTDDLYYRKLESTSTTDLVGMIREKDKKIAELEEELNYAESHCLFHSDCPTQKENAGLKLKLEALNGQTSWKDIKDKSEVVGQLTKAKEQIQNLIKAFVGDLVRSLIYFDKEQLEAIKEAEQFLKDSEVVK